MSDISLSDYMGQLSVALDAVEADLLGATPYHSKRVAVLCLAMGRSLGYDPQRLFCLASCALLHDNALTEYILSEQASKERMTSMKSHCVIGQENCKSIPFPRPIDGFVLYHHERADGQGVFGLKEPQIPEEAALIALADHIDVRYRLQTADAGKLAEIRRDIAAGAGARYTAVAARAALEALDESLAADLADWRIFQALRQAMPSTYHALTDRDMVNLSGIVAKIIDYKSAFTRQHTIQIANKAWFMAGIYHYNQGMRARIYQAAALHDIGKLFIPTGILEKPGRLTEEEFGVIQSHARYTWDVLQPIRGFEQIALWAANHHEKLNGSGYPFGKTGPELDFPSRLLACLDIYQAIREARPYHPARSHREAMDLLYDMAAHHLIDPGITRDLEVLAAFSDNIAPSPALLEPDCPQISAS